MSKADDLRRIREANWHARNKPVAADPVARRKAADAALASALAPPVPITGPLCGHRSVNGKSCIRPTGHSEKQHKYAKPVPEARGD